MSATSIKDKISSAPTKPGVYLFKDPKGRIIYIGKAKNLRSRLKSYVSGTSGLDARKLKMVESARDVSYLLTDNELEALALEANLIKQNRPKFNVVLRDDKNYPYIRIDLNEEWPRIEVVRRVGSDKALYFGPYIPAGGLRETLSFIRKYFDLRPCRYSSMQRVKPCVQYQMGRCPAPCDGKVTREQYMSYVDEVVNFLRGKSKQLLGVLRAQMHEYSEREMYEEAARTRDRILAIEKIWDSQKVVSPRLDDIDVIGMDMRANDIAVVVLFVRKGIMTGSKEFLLSGLADISQKELLYSFIEMFYSNQVIPASNIVLPEMPDDPDILVQWLNEHRGQRVKIEVPKRGTKRKLVEMACLNAGEFLSQQRSVDHSSSLKDLQRLLGLDEAPFSIGAFDISTMLGASPIGAFIYWESGSFIRENYRYVNIKTVKGMDDYAMIKESILRIINKRLKDVPDIIVIDGGKGQLEAARKAFMSLGLEHEPEIIAVAKDPDRVFMTGRRAINIDNSKPASLLLKSIRDEVHRFAITRHRKSRSGKVLSSVLEQIPGIGKKRRLALLRHFGSVERIKKAAVDEISGLEGFNEPIAKRLKEYLNS